MTYHLNGKDHEIQGDVQKSGDWWIGLLVDLPGVNAQEKTQEELIQSLIIGAEDLLTSEGAF